jgi:transcription initiation factor TFIIB
MIKMNKCPECGSTNILFSNKSEKVCKQCGLLIEENLIEQNPFILDSRLSNNENIAGGKAMDGRIVKNSWLYTTRQKNIYNLKKELEDIGRRLKIPEYVVKDAKLMFEDIIKKNLTLGRDNLSFVHACIYISCLMNGLPKTPLEIVAFSDVNINKMLYSYRLIIRRLNLKVPVCDPIDLVPRFGSKLGYKPQTISLANEIIIKLKRTPYMAGKQPSTIVASALYLAGKMNNEEVTQRQIANAIGVIEVTIRKRSREIGGLCFLK